MQNRWTRVSRIVSFFLPDHPEALSMAYHSIQPTFYCANGRGERQVFRRSEANQRRISFPKDQWRSVARAVFKLWEKHQKIMQYDYCVALDILYKWIKKEDCSEYPVELYPLAARVEKLRWDEFNLSAEHRLTWDLLKEDALTFGVEDGDFSVYEAVKRLVEEIDKTQKLSIKYERTLL